MLGVGFALGFFFLSPRQSPELLFGCRIENDSQGATMSQSCVSLTVQKLLKTVSAKQLMEYITAPTTPGVVTTNCHGIAHMIGTSEYRSSRSVERALEKCTPACAGGCLHGVVETAIEDEFGDSVEAEEAAHDPLVLIRSGKKYCTVAELCHGVGHIIFKTFGTYEQALSTCASISEDMNSERCYEGVFMESLGDESSFGFPRAPVVDAQHAQDYSYPCNSVPTPYRLACFRYLPVFQDALFHDNQISNVEQKVTIQKGVCNSFGAEERLKCIFGMAGSVSARIYNRDLDAVMPFCNKYFSDTADVSACAAGIAMNWTQFGEDGRAMNFCAGLDEPHEQNSCYNIAFELILRRVETIERVCGGSNEFALCERARLKYIEHPEVGQVAERALLGKPI